MEKNKLGKSLKYLLKKDNQAVSPVVKENVDAGNVLVDSDMSKAGVLKDISVDLMFPNTYQPRKIFKDDELESLSSSIKEQGVLEPILVRPIEDRFEIIAGERRWRAAKRAGLSKVPVIEKPYDDQKMLEVAIIENLHREDLNPIEKATAYRQLIDTFKLTQDEAGVKLGINRSTLTNFLRLLNLPEQVKSFVSRETLSMGHARCLLSLSNSDEICEVAHKVIAKDMSVRDTEKLVHYLSHGGEQSNTRGVSNSEKSANVIDIEDKLQRSLGTKVSIKETKSKGKGKGKGKIIIDFYSNDDFQRLLNKLQND